ncbi:MAG TPA: N-acetylmuramoyl-L-alanine amidase [Candidatus Kapabacteria bacterium]|nr:N-acetylmuramoyl-L-alanine amidase [Candidatus Kapabacteria bacterium]
MKNKFALAALFVFLIPFTVSPLPALSPLSLNVRIYDHPGFTRVVFESNQGFHYNTDQSKTILEVRLKEIAEFKEDTVSQSVLIAKVTHRVEKQKSIFNIHLKSPFKIQRSFVLEKPFRLVFDLANSGETTVIEEVKKEEAKSEVAKTEPPKAEVKEEEPGKQENKALEQEKTKDINEPDVKATESPISHKKRVVIETICIDPGHGGGDLGAVGKGDSLEKDITVNVAKMLKNLVMSRLGLQVVMTRESDAEVSLNTRVSIANNRKAQMFVSIHVNSSFRKAARGSETFFVSLKATDQEAFQLSQKENQSTEENQSGEETGDVIQDDELKMILWDMAQTEYIKESSRLAEFIQEELNVLLQTKNRGVKQAPFRVLMRAAMPAVLVEIAFLSNIEEEKKLQDDGFLNTVADAIYTGISRYIHYYNNTGTISLDKQGPVQQ